MPLAVDLSPKGCVLNGVETMSCVHRDRALVLRVVLAYVPRRCVASHHSLGADHTNCVAFSPQANYTD
jgi:hypothetical protein